MTLNMTSQRHSFLRTAGEVAIGFLLLFGIPAGGVEPTGTKAGVVQFDAIIELNSSSRDSHVLLFARYWVSADFSYMGIVWGEPHGGNLDLSFYPPSLLIGSDEGKLTITHDVKSEYDGTYEKPVGDRGVFRCMYGDYPVHNLQYVEHEVEATRIHTRDLMALDSTGEDKEQVLDVPITRSDGNVDRIVAHVKARVTNERIDSLLLLGSDNRILKNIDYEYTQSEEPASLLRQHVQLPEHSVMVGLQHGGIVVKVGDKQYNYTEFPAIYHQGGRKCTVEYARVALGGKDVVLPVRTTVCNGKNGKVLRVARMMNFKRVELDANGVAETARQFCGFTDDQRKYRDLLLRYWQKSPAEVVATDANIIAQLRSHFERALTCQDTVGAQLKHVNMLMELDRMAGDATGLSRHYGQYLSILSANGLHRMVQIGGYNAVETLMLWGRYREADVLLDQWMNAILPAFGDREALLRFCGQELQKRNLWTTYKLLERVLPTLGRSAEDRFEILSMRCHILHQLDCFIRDQGSNPPAVLLAQSRWAVASVGQDRLGKILCDSLDEARQMFDLIELPTTVQSGLKESLARIAAQAANETFVNQMEASPSENLCGE